MICKSTSRTPCGVCELKLQEEAAKRYETTGRTPCGVCELKLTLQASRNCTKSRTPCGVCELKFIIVSSPFAFGIVAPRVGCVS